MPESVSRLAIVVDAKDGKKEVDALGKSLGNAEKQGDKTAKSIKKMGSETKTTTDLFSKFKDQIGSSLGNTQVGSSLNDVTQKMTALRGGVGLAAAGLAGLAVGGVAVALAGLSALAIQAAKADAEMLVLANRANTSTQNFQILSHAAEQLGMSQDGLASSLADAQEKLGEFTASGGGGEAADFFEALKNNTKMTDDQIKQFAKTLQGKDGIEALQAMKDELDSVGASAQEQRFVFESLGNDLGNLLPLFEDGGSLLDRYGEALTEAGIIKSKEAIEQSRLLAAQTKSVQTRFEGFKTQLSSQMMPVLNTLLSSFLQGAEDGGQFGSVIQSVGTIAKGVAVGIIGLAGAIQVVIRLIQGFVEQAANVGLTYSNVLMADGVFAKGKALVDGFKNGWSIASDTVEDSVATIKASMSAMNNVLDTSAPKLDKLGQLYYDTSGAIGETNEGLKVNAKNSKDAENASKKAAQEAKKHAQELKRIQEEQLKIQYEYSNKSKQIEMDLQKEIERLQKYGMTQFISTAIQRVNDTKLINDAQLAHDLYSFKKNEQEKLTSKTRVESLRISKSREYNDLEKKERLKALKEQYDHESNLIKLDAERRLFQARQFYMNDAEYMQERYKLERDEIAKNLQLSKEERDARLSASHITESIDSARGRDDALYGMLGASGIDTSAEQAAAQRAEAFQAALDWELITQEEYQQKMLESESQYYRAKAALGLQDAANTTAGLADLMGSLLGEQSAGYKSMFIASKMFALAKVAMNAPETYSNAYNSAMLIPGIGPFVAPVIAGGALAVQLAQAAQIKSMNLTGFATGGYTGNMGRTEVAGVVHGQEYVLNAAATKRVGVDTLNAINSGQSVSSSTNNSQPVVNVYTLPGTTAQVETNTDGSLDIRIRQIAGEVAEQTVVAGFNSQNSRIGKAVKQNYNIAPRR